MATGSLFIIGTRISLRRLEVIPVVGQATVGKNMLPNLFRLDFWKWWKYVNHKAGAPGSGLGGVGRGVPCGRHGKEDGGEVQAVSARDKGLKETSPLPRVSYPCPDLPELESCYTRVRPTK
jgi:hypothetical protein